MTPMIRAALMVALMLTATTASAWPFGGWRNNNKSTAAYCDSNGNCYPASAVTFQPTVVPGSYKAAPTNAVASFNSNGGTASYVAGTAATGYGSHGGTASYGSRWTTAPPSQQSDEWLLAKAEQMQRELAPIMAEAERRHPEAFAKARAKVAAAKCECNGECDCPDCPCKQSNAKAEVDSDDGFKATSKSIGYRTGKLKASSLVYRTAPTLKASGLAYRVPASGPSVEAVAAL